MHAAQSHRLIYRSRIEASLPGQPDAEIGVLMQIDLGSHPRRQPFKRSAPYGECIQVEMPKIRNADGKARRNLLGRQPLTDSGNGVLEYLLKAILPFMVMEIET